MSWARNAFAVFQLRVRQADQLDQGVVMTEKPGAPDNSKEILGSLFPDQSDVLLRNFRPPKPPDVDPPQVVPIPPTPPVKPPKP
jgi:hypothetical protein